MSYFKNVNVVYYYVKNWERAKRFYTDVLEWPVAYGSDEIGWMEFGRDNETHIAINLARPDEAAEPGGHGGAIATLTVDDAHAVTAALRAKGVKCDDVVDIPGVVTYGTFYDPEGNRIQFASSAPPAA
jgi:predicted enzyme related to lactoylglutathione lyase